NAEPSLTCGLRTRVRCGRGLRTRVRCGHGREPPRQPKGCLPSFWHEKMCQCCRRLQPGKEGSLVCPVCAFCINLCILCIFIQFVQSVLQMNSRVGYACRWMRMLASNFDFLLASGFAAVLKLISEMLYVSQLVGRPVFDKSNDKIAVIHDVIVRYGRDDYPPV